MPPEPETGRFDVRTRLFTVVVVVVLVLSWATVFVQAAALALLAMLLVLQRAWRIAVGFLAGWLAVMALSAWVLPVVPAGGVVMTVVLYTIPYLIAGGYGYYLLRSTSPSEIVGGLTRMRLPRVVVIPFAVMLRFFGTIREDVVAIGEAMRLRGLVGPASAVLHPLRTVEYLIIPLLSRSVRSGEDLAASAMCRGLGAPTRPTTTTPLGFGPADAVLALVVVAVVAAALFWNPSV